MNQYRPRSFDEMVSDRPPPTMLTEPLLPDNVIPLLKPPHSLHAVICDALTSNRGLLTRLELGVHVPRQEQREVVRSLYVATRNQVKALAAVLELDGLE